MKYLETKEEKKSFAITSIIFVILLLLCFIFGMVYLDPPPENGIAINFGTTDMGMGDVQPTEPIQSAPQPSNPTPADPTPVVDEVATQDVDDAPVITKEKPKEQKKPKEEPVKPKPQPTPPTPSKSTTDALSSIINGPKNDGKASGGEGDDDTPGDKGDPNGDPYASAYYGGGKGNNGSGKKYGLNGRSIVSSGQVQQDCNESGRVVVQIEVDKTGRVVKTAPVAQGTTNNASCLLKAAMATAMKYKWNLDDKAPDRQIGFIVVNFELGE